METDPAPQPAKRRKHHAWSSIRLWRLNHAPRNILLDIGLKTGKDRRKYRGWVARVPNRYRESREAIPLALFSSPWFAFGDVRVVDHGTHFYVVGHDKGPHVKSRDPKKGRVVAKV